MNGVHDMGGMHGLGPVERDPDEPVFHASWEARALALTLAMGAWGKWNIDASRHQRELIPGPAYLRMTYYEKWVAALSALMVKTGLVAQGELASGRPAAGARKVAPALPAERVAQVLGQGSPATRDVAAARRFAIGDRVRTRNIHPPGHTRLPRSARDRIGVVARDNGVHVFPDSNAHFLGEKPQRLYSVRFAARELWGEQAGPLDAVYVDLWDDHLDPA
jgi:nitrile hydratase